VSDNAANTADNLDRRMTHPPLLFLLMSNMRHPDALPKLLCPGTRSPKGVHSGGQLLCNQIDKARKSSNSKANARGPAGGPLHRPALNAQAEIMLRRPMGYRDMVAERAAIASCPYTYQGPREMIVTR
jgi:hypothetical protein